MRKNFVVVACLFAAFAMVTLPGCGSKEDMTQEPIADLDVVDATSALTGDDVPLTEQPDDIVYVEPGAGIFTDIHFEFDRYNIMPGDEARLQRIADWLKDNDQVRVMIEGHCDERGTNEYNMALGEQRALAARRYLVGLGVGSSRLGTISYGEEQPMDPRSTEDAWAKNRRAHFVVSQ
jgi:peptidoglycan-associated lipoprotein